MIGAIIGDIVGSRFEWNNIKSKHFELFTKECMFTDDSAMTCAIAEALIQWDKDRRQNLKELTITSLRKIAKLYPDAGYGEMFGSWVLSDNPQPYNSFGNGSAMRASPCGWFANSLEEAQELARITASVTHNHPEGIKGAVAVSSAIYLAKTGKSIKEIGNYINTKFYKIEFTLEHIRPTYSFDVTCQGSVPQAIECFLESTSYEDCIRNAISLGGDSDTIAAIAGSIAEAYYGIDKELINKAITYLPDPLIKIIKEFEIYKNK